MKKVNIFNLDKTPVENIDFSTPCIFILGGAISGKELLRIVSFNRIKDMLSNMGLCANVYVNTYDLSMLNEKFANVANKINDKFFNPNKNVFVFGFQLFVPLYFNAYVQRLFDSLILPRLVDSDGNALPVDIVQNNLRKIVFYSHCYGNRVANRLDKKLTQHLKKLNYSADEIKQIQKQLVFICQSSAFLFKTPKSTYLNFLSLSDAAVLFDKLYSINGHITYIEKYHAVSVPRVYKGNPGPNKLKNIEHKIWPLIENSRMTNDGKTIIQIMDNVFYQALTLPHLEGESSLLNYEKLNQEIKSKTLLRILEKVPTNKLKNTIFASASVFNCWKDNFICRLQKNR